MTKPNVYVYAEKMYVRSTVGRDNRVMYVLTDIGNCLGYKAPRKFAERAPLHKEKVLVPWFKKNRHGSVLMWCASKENLLKMCDDLCLDESFADWCRSLDDVTTVSRKVCKVHKSKEPSDQKKAETRSGMNDAIIQRLDSLISSCLELKREIESL